MEKWMEGRLYAQQANKLTIMRVLAIDIGNLAISK